MESLVDLSRIQETSDGDTEFEQELIEMYLDDAAVHARKIAGSVASSDADSIKATAHTLKGASANIGAQSIQEIAFEIEKAALAHDLTPLPELHRRLEEALAKTDTFFRDYLKSLQ
ncbi:Hpt domain-containing protein [Sulfidibacter corallicola]